MSADLPARRLHIVRGGGTAVTGISTSHAATNDVTVGAEVIRTEAGPREVIPIDLLYPAQEAIRTELLKVLSLLREAIAQLDAARASMAKSDEIDADGAAQKMRMALPELFRYRALGDGFGNIVNSLHFAFLNANGKPLSPRQLDTIWRVLKALRQYPFLSLESSLPYVEELEEAGLQVVPAALSDVDLDE